jgi:hypothetical protein
MTDGKEPITPYVNPKGMEDTAGLTKREYFAAMAMQGLLAQHVTFTKGELRPGAEYANEPVYKMAYIDSDGVGQDYLAEDAVSIADALINELNKTNG